MTNLTDIRALREEQERLLGQMERQLQLEEKTGIKAHEIRGITNHPVGYDTPQYTCADGYLVQGRVEYRSTVRMKDGSVVEVDFDVKLFLDGGTE